MHILKTPTFLRDNQPLSMNTVQAPLPVQNILAVYEQLKTRVSAALHTQLGDAARLGAQRQECSNLLSHINAVRLHYSPLFHYC